MIATTLSRKIHVGTLIKDEEPLEVAVDIFIPAQPAKPAIVYFCLPGSGQTKDYFHLDVRTEDDVAHSIDFSFARQMAARGAITVSIDHLGVGRSSRPLDGFALTPDIMVAAIAHVVDTLKAELRAGTVDASLPATELRSIGVGHSMGGLLTILTQAERRCYDALVILGYSGTGREAHVTDAERPYMDDPSGLRANIVRITRLRTQEPYMTIDTRGRGRALYGGDAADRNALRAVKAAGDKMLAVMSFFAMIPNSAKAECAAIDVPLLAAVGDADITGDAHAIPARFPACSDITLLVLKDTGHTHFTFASCEQLFERIGRWGRSPL